MMRRLWVPSLALVAGAALLFPSAPVAAQSGLTSRVVEAPVLRTPVLRDVFVQESTKNRSKGALWGGAIGLVAGGVLGGISVDSDEGGTFEGGLTEAAATGEAVFLGAVLGAGIGALLGATVFAPDRQASAFSVAPVVGVQGAGVTVRLR